VLYIMAGASYGLAGDTENAKRTVKQLTDLVPNISAAGIEATFPYYHADDRARLLQGLRAGGLS
jgi:hypothetical protein